MKLICINDKNKPNEIPFSHWVKEGEPYTYLKSAILHAQGGRLGIQIEEIDLSPFEPIIYFDASRFRQAHPSEIKKEENILQNA